MKYLGALCLLFFSQNAFANGAILTDGWNSAEVRGFGNKRVVVRAEVGPSKAANCTGWRWGAESQCPPTALLGLNVFINGEQVFVPQSAFYDLGSPKEIELITGVSSLDVIVNGGIGASAYTATLRFSKTQLKRRKVAGKEFETTAWEETAYSFPR